MIIELSLDLQKICHHGRVRIAIFLRRSEMKIELVCSEEQLALLIFLLCS
jgi:hypothetical protein